MFLIQCSVGVSTSKYSIYQQLFSHKLRHYTANREPTRLVVGSEFQKHRTRKSFTSSNSHRPAPRLWKAATKLLTCLSIHCSYVMSWYSSMPRVLPEKSMWRLRSFGDNGVLRNATLPSFSGIRSIQCGEQKQQQQHQRMIITTEAAFDLVRSDAWPAEDA